MFLLTPIVEKDGKVHRYFSIVENHRVACNKTVQRTAQAAWRKTLSLFDEQEQEYENLSLFPDDREIPADAVDSLQVKLSGLELRRPRLLGDSMRVVAATGPAGVGQAGRAFQFVQMQVPREGQQVTRETFQFRGDKKKLQEAEWSDGHYLLRCNLTAGGASVLWTRYVQLTQIEAVFRALKNELCIRSIRHQLEHRADAHILIAILAYCLQVMLKQRLWLHAPGLTPTAVLEKLADIK